MSGYGPLYWPWSCPVATAGAGADDNISSRTAVVVSVVILAAAAAVIVVAGEQDERVLQTVAGVPEDRVVTRRATAATAVAVVAARTPRRPSWVTTVLIGRRRSAHAAGRVASPSATGFSSAHGDDGTRYIQLG